MLEYVSAFRIHSHKQERLWNLQEGAGGEEQETTTILHTHIALFQRQPRSSLYKPRGKVFSDSLRAAASGSRREDMTVHGGLLDVWFAGLWCGVWCLIVAMMVLTSRFLGEVDVAFMALFYLLDSGPCSCDVSGVLAIGFCGCMGMWIKCCYKCPDKSVAVASHRYLLAAFEPIGKSKALNKKTSGMQWCKNYWAAYQNSDHQANGCESKMGTQKTLLIKGNINQNRWSLGLFFFTRSHMDRPAFLFFCSTHLKPRQKRFLQDQATMSSQPCLSCFSKLQLQPYCFWLKKGNNPPKNHWKHWGFLFPLPSTHRISQVSFPRLLSFPTSPLALGPSPRPWDLPPMACCASRAGRGPPEGKAARQELINGKASMKSSKNTKRP